MRRQLPNMSTIFELDPRLADQFPYWSALFYGYAQVTDTQPLVQTVNVRCPDCSKVTTSPMKYGTEGSDPKTKVELACGCVVRLERLKGREL